MTFTTSDPIDNSERILVRNTATGFEQGIAGGVGFFTAGPLGAILAWAAIRGLQGKWTPWTLLGMVASPALILFQGFLLAIVLGSTTPDIDVRGADIDVTIPEEVNKN